MAGSLDGYGQLTLMLSTTARYSSGKYFALLGQILSQFHKVFVIYGFNLIGAERTYLTLCSSHSAAAAHLAVAGVIAVTAPLGASVLFHFRHLKNASFQDFSGYKAYTLYYLYLSIYPSAIQ
jgi:hypothetical protein